MLCQLKKFNYLSKVHLFSETKFRHETLSENNQYSTLTTNSMSAPDSTTRAVPKQIHKSIFIKEVTKLNTL